MIKWLSIAIALAIVFTNFGLAEATNSDSDFWKAGWEFTYIPRKAITPPANISWIPTQRTANQPGRNGDDALWMRHQLPTSELMHLVSPTLLLPIVDQGVQIFTDEGMLIFSSGITPDHQLIFTGYPYVRVPLNNARNSDALIFRILSDHTNIGLSGDISIQEPEPALRALFANDIPHIAIGIVLVVLGLFLIPFYLQNRRDLTALFYAIFLISIGVYVASITNLTRYLVTNETSLTRHWVEIIALFAGAVSYSSYCDSVFIFPRGKHWIRRLVVQPYAFFCAATLIAAALGVVPLLKILPVWQIYSLAVIFLTFPIHAIRERNPEALAFVLGVAGYAAGAITGILSALLIVPRTFGPFAITAGVASVAVSMGYVIIYRYREMNRQVRNYADSLEKTNAQLQELDRMKDQFLANTSHELRTPIVGILGIAESLTAGAAGEISPRIRRYLDLIMLSTRRLTNLVNDILDFSKMRENHITLQIESVDMADTAALAIATCTPLIGRKDISLENTLTNALPEVLGDAARLQQILINLLGNAIKFTESGQVVLSASEKECYLEISITDTGVGISPEHHQRIFQQFEQGDASTTRRFGGSGLGLAITKHLVELQGGTITFTSEVNRGSCFTFTIPYSERRQKESTHSKNPTTLLATSHTSDVAQEENLQALAAGGKSPRTERILVVDDEHINREVLQSQLALGGFQATLAESGDEALKILREGFKPDLLLLDVMMPGLSGYDVCRTIRENFNMDELPIIFVTAKNQLSNLVEGFSAGGNDYLVKPFLHGELLARIETQLQIMRLAATVRCARDRTASALKVAQVIMTRGDHLAMVAEGCSAIIRTLAADFPQDSISCQAFLKEPPGSLNGLQFVLREYSTSQTNDRETVSLSDTHPVMLTSYHKIEQVGWSPVIQQPTPTVNRTWVWNRALTLCLMQGEKFIGLIEISIPARTHLSDEDQSFLTTVQDTITLGLTGISTQQHGQRLLREIA